MFLKLTHQQSGNDLLVSLDTVTSIYVVGDCVRICFNYMLNAEPAYIHVREPLEQIEQMIKEREAGNEN